MPASSLEDGQITLEMQAEVERLRQMQEQDNEKENNFTDEELQMAAEELIAREAAGEGQDV